MSRHRIYAVVDIETTGTNPATDRIIQFGCVLIQEGQVIQRFATDVNPGKKIPKQIQNLTHITNYRVQKAPYFEDVAPIIYNLLQDTTFIAHNIFFDYKFLSAELIRCGLPELTIPGIDTVELAQILLPTEVSFRLSDLAASLGIEHENPHQADSDAEVTGALFLYLDTIAHQLPQLTLKKIARLSSGLAMQTGAYLQRVVLEQEKHLAPLASDLEVVEGLVLQKKQVKLFEAPLYQSPYPKKKKSKERLFKTTLAFRKEQARLMNLVDQHFQQSAEKNLFIEASTGMGKSIGYLLPASFGATPENPVVVSTLSLILQNQLMTKDIPKLNQILPQKIQATIVKSHRHFIDLQRFAETLAVEVRQKQYAIFQMATLVWLTKTQTGDFEELNLINLNHQFFQEVQHRGLKTLTARNPFYAVDFLRFNQASIRQSNFLIVNHAFLAHENLRPTPSLPPSSRLIIDEAHHLPDICEKVATRQFDFGPFAHQIQFFQQEFGVFDQLLDLLQEHEAVSRSLSLYYTELEALVENFDVLIEALQQPTSSERLIKDSDLVNLSRSGKVAIRKIQIYYQEIMQLQQQLQVLLTPLSEQWLAKDHLLYLELLDLFSELVQQSALMTQWLSDWQPHLVHGFVQLDKRRGASLKLTDFAAELLPTTSWYARFEKIIYLGGTLKIATDRQYFPKRLGVASANLKVIQAPFDYQKQARLYVSTGQDIQQMPPQVYADYLAQSIELLVKDLNKPVLVLFTSHESLQLVYKRLHQKFLSQGREILAQGIGGSREKLLKRFSRSDSALLFGADSFWEGIDLPGDKLQIVIVTRLPFENPKRPLVNAKNSYLTAQGINPFTENSLPRAGLKLRQGLGRLIRSTTDTGGMIVLDQRIVTTKYGQQLRRLLPKELPVIQGSLPEISKNFHKFLENPEQTKD
ncbi:MAG: helicase C-terminal domain-containing protein [Enterococcus sp.]